MPIDLNLLLEKGGPYLLMTWVILRELLPFLRDKLFPQVLSERKAETERRWALNERQVQAQENIAKAMQQTMILLATLDARIEVMATGVQRVEVITTEINTRSRAREQEIPTVRRPAENEKAKSLSRTRQSAKVES